MTNAAVPSLAPDFVDLLTCLNEAGAKYILVGDIRATQDLDVWIRPSSDNAARVWSALAAFGMPGGLSLDVLGRVDGPPPTGFRFGRPPFAVDLLTSIRGVEFESAWRGSFLRDIEGVQVRVIGLDALLQNKRSTGRPKDALDVEALERLTSARGT